MRIISLQTEGTIGLQSRNITFKKVKFHLSLTDSFQIAISISTGSNIPFKKRRDSCNGLVSIFHSISSCSNIPSKNVQILVTDLFQFSISISTGSNTPFKKREDSCYGLVSIPSNLDWQQHSIRRVSCYGLSSVFYFNLDNLGCIFHLSAADDIIAGRADKLPIHLLRPSR